ncbi:hypothetical protein N9C67_00150 [Gammaproteobacteria bacterium]|nr:hypothetical protein [Gammaproteobacteria bacterium]
MKKRNLLIICSNIKDIHKIYKLDLSIYSSVVIASDDIKVHKEVKKLEIIDKVIFLQKPIAYTKVADGVIEMIRKVNNYFEKLAELDIFNRKELFWTYHVEGGYTTQRLQDTLLAIECANLIFDEFAINELVTFGSNNSLMIKIFKRLASQKGYKTCSYNHKYSLNKRDFQDIIRPIYYLIRSLLCKISSKRSKHLDSSNIVLFQVCGSSSKHISNALLPQNEFLKNGLTPLNILWGNSKEVKNINNMGYKAISLESYLRYSDFFISLFKLILVFKKIKTLKSLFYKTNTFMHKDIDISDIVYGSVLKYLYIDGPENFRYRMAAQRFVSEYSEHLVAIKYCAAKYLTQGTIMSEIFEDKYIKFDYEVGIVGPNSYLKHNSKRHLNFFSNNFIKFASNDTERHCLIEYENVSEKNAIVYGAGRADSHFKNVNVFSKENSKKIIGIKEDYDIHMLFDYSGTLPGYISIEEASYHLDTVMDFCKDYPNIALIIKPHPSADMSILSNALSNKTNNIYVVDKNTLPDHALNIADIMITKFSYMGIEAMIYNVQVVSLLFDDESMFKVFGEAAEYIYDKEELIMFLKNTFSTKNAFIQWKEQYKEKGEKFIKQFYPNLGKSAEEIIAKTITRRINDRKYI